MVLHSKSALIFQAVFVSPNHQELRHRWGLFLARSQLRPPELDDLPSPSLFAQLRNEARFRRKGDFDCLKKV